MGRNCEQNIPGGEKVQVNAQIQSRCGKDYNSIVYKSAHKNTLKANYNNP